VRRDLFLKFAICAGLVALVWIVFGQTIGFQFVNYDDPLYVIDNAHIRNGLNWHNIVWAFTHIHSQNWHPLTSISLMLDCQLSGPKPGAIHFTNVLMHSAAAVLLFIALEQMTASVWTSAFVATVFAIHPQHVESVAWIAERKDVLSGLFFALTLIGYFHYTQKQTAGRYAAMSILFACGLMSKPMLVTLPIVLLLLDYWPLNRFEKASAVKLFAEKIPLFVLVVGSCFMTFWAQNFALGSSEFLPLKWRITNAIFSCFEYVRQMICPFNLIPFYVHPENRLEMGRLLIAAIFIVVVTAIVLWRHKTNPYLIVGWFWYLVMLIPVIGIVQVGLQGRADRYTYLPEIGLYLALAWLIRDLTKAWRYQTAATTSAATVAIGAMSILSWKQTTHWRDTESLWTYTLTVTPDSDVAHTGLGGILFERGRVNEAIAHYERALSLRDGNVGAQFGLARALASEHKIDLAIEHLQKTLSLQPDNVAASNDLGVLFASEGEISKAIAAWRQTLSFDPDNADAANDLAWVLATATDATLRNGNEAVRLAQIAIRNGGENPVSLRTLSAALAEHGRFDEAAGVAERAENLAKANQDAAMSDSLRRCVESFRRGEPLHVTQVAH
jgi:tetratricopeptide (TPR) repeat protein